MVIGFLFFFVKVALWYQPHFQPHLLHTKLARSEVKPDRHKQIHTITTSLHIHRLVAVLALIASHIC